MTNVYRLLAVYCVFFGMQAFGKTFPMQEIEIAVPDGWKLAQEGRGNDVLFAAFANGDQSINFYVKNALKLDMKSIFANGAEVRREAAPERHGPFQWNIMQTTKTTRLRDGSVPTYYVTSFLVEYHGVSYYGFSRGTDSSGPSHVVAQFLNGVSADLKRGPYAGRSLTGPDYTGKKYYFGFGDQLDGEMGNEVQYDVKHTNDLFTKDIGGSYIGFTKLDPGHDGITQHWADLKSEMTANDMYIQYSSGHGSEGADGGLMAGVSWQEITDNTLSLPAKEIVVFTMACFSGNIVDLINQKKSVWQDWQSQGRTLFVMDSSQADQESSTGPGTDPDEPGGPDGSAGSAFGFALWKAIIGYADGYVDGVKDGFVSLEEIKEYTTAKAKEVGGQDPVATGAYDGKLIMDKVPPHELVAELEAEGGTAGMTKSQIMEAIQKLDRQLRVR